MEFIDNYLLSAYKSIINNSLSQYLLSDVNICEVIAKWFV